MQVNQATFIWITLFTMHFKSALQKMHVLMSHLVLKVTIKFQSHKATIWLYKTLIIPSLYRKQWHEHLSAYFPLCLTEESKSYEFGMNYSLKKWSSKDKEKWRDKKRYSFIPHFHSWIRNSLEYVINKEFIYSYFIT